MKKRKWIGPILVVALLAGLSLLLYPTFSNYWNSTRQSREVASYAKEVETIGAEEKARMWEDAVEYNADLLEREDPFDLSDELRARYERLLKTSGHSVLAYIDIPVLKLTLPVYHGTSDVVLKQAVGHIDWTSLPVGGLNTHSALSGHRGLPSARLFTDLGKLVEGDLFMLRVLDETLTYEVDQILIVEPYDLTPLEIVEGMDYCTLVTCTPYGVNTHRMLVRGHRIENVEAAKIVQIIAEAIQIDPMVISVCVGVPMLLLLLVWVWISDHILRARRAKKRKTPIILRRL